MEMNQQNMMPNFFDQQSNVNGYPSGYQPNQQMPMNSFSSPTSTTNPFMNNPAFRQQNGMSRFGMPEGENFNDMPPNSASSQQNFPNFMDPRMGGFDPRSRPGFDGSFKEGFSGMPGIDGFSGGNPSYGGKPRMPQDLAAAMFGNPAALAAYQRQRMSMFGQGRENDFLSPTNPFGGFNPQQYAHQQRFTAALQRQAQEQMAQQQQQQHQMPGSRSGGDFARQFYGAGGSGSQGSGGPNGGDPNAFGMMNQGQDGFPGGGGGASGFPGMRGGPRSEQQMKMEQAKMEHAKQAKMQEQQAKMEQHMKEQMEQAKMQEQQQSQGRMDPQVNQSPGERGSSNAAGAQNMMNPPNMNQYDMSRFPGPNNGTGGTPRPPFDQSSDSQRQAAMLAAAAVRAAAAASSRGRQGGFNQGGPGSGNFPYAQRGFAGNPELLGSPFGQQNMSSPSHDFPNMMSPSKDMSMRNLSQSPMSQGRLTPRNGNPPPYSPMPSSDSLGAPPSIKGSYPNLTNTPKLVKPDDMSEGAQMQGRRPPGQNSDDAHGKDPGLKKENEDDGFLNTANCLQPNERTGAKLSAPPTPMSAMSPSPSPHHDNLDIDALSPSWPQTPASPNTQKTLRARSSPHQFDQLSKIYDAIEDEEQRNFYDRYLAFMSVNGTPITSVPVIGKRPLDLYTLFRSVAERGGIQEVMEKRRFREIMRCLNLPSANFSLSFMVKEQYMKYLHTYEVKMKDVLMKQWKTSITLDHGLKPPSGNVPTIALNDSLNSAMKDMKGPQGPPNHAFRPPSSQNWDNSSSMPPISSTTGPSGPGQGPPQGPYPPQRMPYFNQSANMSGYPGQDMPPNYPPNNYGQYGPQNPMFGPRGPMGSYGPMQQGMHPGMPPNESMSPGWPRGYPPRQGPPELFPEGLQRMPWSQPHHPMSAYSNRSPNFPGGKLRGPMPPVSRDPLEQMKMQQQQHQMKLQHQMQQSHHRPQFTHPPAPNKSLPAQQPPPVVRGPISPIVQQSKREMTFPADSVESTKPVLKKRKKLTSKDLGPVEAWRIMMSLKSGLIAECTWAIDTLNVLLSDNNTITYFHLNQLPGLLDTLMDHYRRCLNDVFGLFSESEIALYPELEKSNEPNEKTVNNLLRALWVGVCKNAPSSYTASIASISVEGGFQEKLDGGKDYWQRGTGDNTSHIQMSFPTETVKVKAFPEEDRYHNNELFAPPPKISKPDTPSITSKVPSRCSSPTVKNETKTTPIKQERLPANISSTPRSRPSTPSKLETTKKMVTNCVTNCLKRSLSSSTLPISDKPPSSPANILERKLSGSMKNCIKSESDSPDSGEYIGLEVLENLIKEYDDAAKESSLPDHPIIEKLRNDLDLNIQCDKKYLEDSKEFIGYLTRRLRRENRGHVKSDECNSKQNAPLLNCSDNKQSLLHRCLALSNVFRSLSYMSSNDPELCGHVGLQLLVGSILLHRHEHPVTDHAEFKLGQDDPTVSSQASLNTWNNSEIWWDTLKSVRENTLVMLSNIGGHMNLRTINKEHCKNIVTGLLHWISCPSSEGLDPMPTAPAQHALSPRRMAIETLAKVSINSSNIDPLVSCSSDGQLKDVSDVLVQVIASKRPIPTREFAIILLDNLSQSERFASLLARRKSSITNVIKFIQEAEKNTSNYLSQGGRVQPGLNAEDICGTSISLLRRSVNILLSVAKCACNAEILLPHTDHLLALSTSQMIDTSVLALLSEVLFELSQHDSHK